jgi:hypothetical protein
MTAVEAAAGAGLAYDIVRDRGYSACPTRIAVLVRLLVAPPTGAMPGVERAAANFLRRHAAATQNRPVRRGGHRQTGRSILQVAP